MAFLFVLSCFLNAIASFLLGFFVFIKNRKNILNISWALTCFSVGLWALGLFFVVFCKNLQLSLFWLKVHYFGAFFIPSCFLFFILSFLDISKRYKYLIFLAFGLSLFFLYANFHNLISMGVSPKFFNCYYTDAGILFSAFIIEYFSVATIAHLFAFFYFNNLNRTKKNQLTFILIGSVVGFIGGGTTIFPVYNWNIYPFGSPFVFFYTVLVSYAITKTELMDIRVVIGRTAAYVASIFSVLLLAGGAIYLNTAFFTNSPILQFAVFSIFALTAVAIFEPIRSFIQTPIEEKWITGWYDSDKLLNSIAKDLAPISEREEAFRVIAKQLQDTIKIKDVNVLLGDEKNKLGFKDVTYYKDNLYLPLFSTEALEGIIVLG
ncbi:MAG: putative histidine kinase, partial [Parcubacteria group bacterium Athens1014_10]